MINSAAGALRFGVKGELPENWMYNLGMQITSARSQGEYLFGDL